MSVSCRLKVVKRKMLMVIQQQPALHSIALGKLQVAVQQDDIGHHSASQNCHHRTKQMPTV